MPEFHLRRTHQWELVDGKYFEEQAIRVDGRSFAIRSGTNTNRRDLGRLMRLQGCRPEEIQNLQRTDVEIEKGKLWIRKGKTKAARRVLQLLPESREILARRLSASEGIWVFSLAEAAGQPHYKTELLS